VTTPDRVTLTADVTADRGRRIIAGVAVPWDVVANTSAGPTRFAAGSITWDAERAPRLVREHDRTAVLGTSTLLADTGDALRGSWRIAETTAGSDALVEAAEGLRAGLSVGVAIDTSEFDDDGTLVVTGGRLDHVGLVVDPAFGEGSQVDHVAASTPDPDPNTHPAPQHQETPTVDVTPVTPPAPPTPDPDTAGATAPEAAVLEAARVQVGADREVDSLTAGAIMRYQVLAAARNDPHAQRMVQAALAIDNTTAIPGMIPEARTRDLIAIIDGRRPFADSIERRPLPASGMKVTTPRLTQKPSQAVTAESAEVSSTQVTVVDDETGIVKIAGGNRLTVEVIERSDPSYLDELLRLHAEGWARTSNAYVRDQLVAAASASVASAESTYNEQLALGITDSLGERRLRPNRVGIALNVYSALLAEEDNQGRPLWDAVNPMNAPGDALDPERGTLKGVPSFVDVDADDDLILVYPSDAGYLYEQPGGPVTIRTAQVSTLEWEVAMYGFLAVQDRYAAAIRTVSVGI